MQPPLLAPKFCAAGVNPVELSVLDDWAPWVEFFELDELDTKNGFDHELTVSKEKSCLQTLFNKISKYWLYSKITLSPAFTPFLNIPEWTS